MASEDKKIYEFGNFRFDAECLQLEHAEQYVKIPPKSLEALKVLLEQRGKIVTRENLLEKIWGNSFVEDANLTVAVSTLRKTLAVYEAYETYIQTVPHVGYRFVPETDEKLELANDSIIFERHELEQVIVEDNSNAQKTKNHSKIYAVFLAATILLMLIAAFVWQGREKSFGANLTENVQAFNAYQKGDALLKKRQVCESISYFQEATAYDANFAEAFASLAAAQAMCGVTGEIEENVGRAIALDPNLALAHATNGFIRMFLYWDWQKAENSLRLAIALDPNSAHARHWLGVYLSVRGRFDEAIGEMLRAIEIEPDSPLYLADLGQIYYFRHDYDRAAYYCRKALALDPDNFFATQHLRDIYLMRGDDANAMKFELERGRNLGSPPDSITATKERFEREGLKNYWQKSLDYELLLWNGNGVKPESRSAAAYTIASYYNELGDRENTLEWLTESVENSSEGKHVFYLPYLNVDPRYDWLRDERRFQAMLQKMSLVE